ncbi:hypothetical protein INR49_032902 [Caranx melampygus]|nr:hypothetical protein INR49_032902 [Caranx melampygus]
MTNQIDRDECRHDDRQPDTSIKLEAALGSMEQPVLCYELTRKLSTDLEVADPQELNNFYPLAPYMVRGRLMVSPKIGAEFMRLVSADLYKSFFDGLDKYAPRLLEMYRVRSSSSSDLRSLLQPLDVQDHY